MTSSASKPTSTREHAGEPIERGGEPGHDLENFPTTRRRDASTISQDVAELEASGDVSRESVSNLTDLRPQRPSCAMARCATNVTWLTFRREVNPRLGDRNSLFKNRFGRLAALAGAFKALRRAVKRGEALTARSPIPAGATQRRG
jgi:hypothetical protein